MEYLEGLLSLVANAAILIFEFIGVGIIIYAGLTGFLRFVRRAPDTKIYLAKGLAMGLEFKMGSEILRTVVVREWREIGIVAGIIALRAALTFLIHWEIKEEEKTGELFPGLCIEPSVWPALKGMIHPLPHTANHSSAA